MSTTRAALGLRPTGRITYLCHVCASPIDPSSGILYCPWTEIREAHAYDLESIRHPRGAISIGELLALHHPHANWRTRHVACEDGVDEQVRDGYDIDLDQADTAAWLLHWTAHLFSKTWFASTNWDTFLRGALGCLQGEAPATGR